MKFLYRYYMKPLQIANFSSLMFKENMMDYPNTGDYLFKLIQKSCRNAAGMPLSVQVIGRPFQEELVLHAMKEVERISVYRPKLKQN